MIIMNSSYKNTLDYSDIFKTICFLKKPKEIVEIGILDGFSLKAIADVCPTSNIKAFDIFEDFNGNASNRNIIEKFQNYSNIEINYGNFYELYKVLPDQSIDLLHIDIANDGQIYEIVFENYISKLRQNGIILLEGGSEERDNIYWMKKYNKNPIQLVIEKYKNKYEIYTLEKFPSLTIIKI